MKNFLIFCSILIVTLIAFLDARDRFCELDKNAANTPAQVELNQTMTRPEKNEIERPEQVQQVNPNKLQEKINEDKPHLQNTYDKIKDRRNTITNPIN